METLMVMLLLVGAIIMFFVFQKNIRPKRSTYLKKEQIVFDYESELQNILIDNKDDKNRQIREKKRFLIKCSCELSRNIFFDEKESKEVIQKLANI